MEKQLAIKIGQQEWMVENLNVTSFRNGDPIPEAQTAAEWEEAARKKQPVCCYHQDDPVNGYKYGRLYNWYALNDPRGLAPEGWKIPEMADFDALLESCGGQDEIQTNILYRSFAQLPIGCRYANGSFGNDFYGLWSDASEIPDGGNPICFAYDQVTLAYVQSDAEDPRACGLFIRVLRSPLESGKKSRGADKHLVLDDLWIEKIDNSDLAAQLEILSDPKCPVSLLRYVWRLEWFKEHWLYPFVNWYLQAIAQNPKTPEYIVRDLISHSCYFVQEAAAANPAFNIEKSSEILESGNRHVLLGCLNNTNTPKATKTQIRKLLKDTDAYPLHWMEISENTDDEELSMHPQRFHNLILGDAKLLYEEIFCTDEDYMTYDLSELKACYSDDENFFQEHPEISENANEVFFYEFDQYKNGIPAFYQVSIYIPDYEATAVRVVGINDVLEKFIRERGAYEELWSWVSDEHTWLCSCRDIRRILKYCEAAR